MTTFADLHETVRAALASRRLGKPVFVRYHWQAPDRASLLPQLARMTAAARDWLGQAIAHIYAAGSVENGSVSLTLELRNGATALVSAATGAPHGAGVDLWILGNRGTLFHDAGHSPIGGEPLVVPDQPPETRLLARIQKALVARK
jgi:predicted dehydrogenase